MQERGSKMKERTGMITMKGSLLTLIGEEVKVGDPAPEYSVRQGVDRGA